MRLLLLLVGLGACRGFIWGRRSAAAGSAGTSATTATTAAGASAFRPAGQRGRLVQWAGEGDEDLMAALAARIDQVRARQSAESYRVGRNWGNAEWTTRGMVAAGVRFRRVAVTSPRETVVGTSDGTVLLLDTGAERLASFRRNASDYDFEFEAGGERQR